MDSELLDKLKAAAAQGGTGPTSKALSTAYSKGADDPGQANTLSSYYNQAYQDLAASYAARRATEQQNYDRSIAALDQNKTAQENQLADTREQRMREAYIAQRKNQRDLPAVLAAQGITGGLSESTYGDMTRDYENSRGNAYSDYSTNQNALALDYSNKRSTYDNSYNSALSALDQQHDQDAWTRAQSLFDQWQAQEQLRMQQEQFEEQKRQWQAAYDLQQQQLAAAAAAAAAPAPTWPSKPTDTGPTNYGAGASGYNSAGGGGKASYTNRDKKKSKK